MNNKALNKTFVNLGLCLASLLITTSNAVAHQCRMEWVEEYDPVRQTNIKVQKEICHDHTPQPATPVSIRVNTGGPDLNIRRGPSTNYRILGRLANGTAVNLNGQSQGSWVQLTNGGWISARYLRM